MKRYKLLLILFLIICFTLPAYSFSTFRALGGLFHKPAAIQVTAPTETPVSAPTPSKTQIIEPFKLSVSASKIEALPLEKVKISAMATGGVKPYKYEWYLDGVFSPNCADFANVDVWHGAIGEHFARVIVKDSSTPPAQAEGAVKFKVILAELKIDLSINKSKIKPGESVKAIAKVTGGVPKYTYAWTLDGAPCPECDVPAVTASPKDAGSHLLVVIVTDSAKPSVQVQASIMFTVVKKTSGKLTVELVADKTNVKPEEKVMVTAEVTGGVPPYEYKWHLNGKLNSERKSNSVKAYGKKPGKYEVKVEVTDSAKKSEVVSFAVSFNVIEPSSAQASLPQKENTIWDQFIGTWKGWAKIIAGAVSEDESKPFSVLLKIGPYGNTYAIYIGNEIIGDPTGYKVSREGNTLTVTYYGHPVDTKGKIHIEAMIDVKIKLTVNGAQMTGGEWFTYSDKETSSRIELSLTLDKQ